MNRQTLLLLILSSFTVPLYGQNMGPGNNSFTPLSYAQADRMADSVTALMTLDEKIAYVGGDRSFFIRPVPRLGLKEVYMSDATQGVHIRNDLRGVDPAEHSLVQSTAFPCPISLAATWDPALAHRYAEAIGEECRAGNIGILLGPGMNSYRVSQCGRNFEYFGEDPFLRSRLIEAYVAGVQSTGTIATLKHFVANNSDYYRRRSNSIVDERALHEIYLPPFKAGIDAGAKAVMTSYNLLNGEWCGQSAYVIDTLLRRQLGFSWLVMTDWRSVYDGEKVVNSGQDLEMPVAFALKDLRALIDQGKIPVARLDAMVRNILRTYFAMKLGDRVKSPITDADYARHENVALEAAREGIVLLKNDAYALPIGSGVKKILLTGRYVDSLAAGGGSAAVKGYNNRLMRDEFAKIFGSRLSVVLHPSVEEVASADVVLCNVGTTDVESWDRPFALPEEQESLVKRCVQNNPNTVVIVTSGSGIRMTDWRDKARAIVYAWYGGQNGNQALAEVIAGTVNPSGKLPITIEKEFADSPGSGYIPAGQSLYAGRRDKEEAAHPLFDVAYQEGIFTGYRWYEKKNIEPLFPFGHGLSYTHFVYSDLQTSGETPGPGDTMTVRFRIANAGSRRGTETVQLYVQDMAAPVPRPVKELKAFRRVELDPGQSATVSLTLDRNAFSYWDPGTGAWQTHGGPYTLQVGSSSQDIRLKKEIALQ